MLTSWKEIHQALRRYPIRSAGNEVTSFDFPPTGPVAAIFQVVWAEILGRKRIFIGVHVAKDGPSWTHEALVVNSETVIGALTAFKGNIVLKHVMTVGRFDEAELHEAIAAMARTVETTQGRLLAQVPVPHSTYVD